MKRTMLLLILGLAACGTADSIPPECTGLAFNACQTVYPLQCGGPATWDQMQKTLTSGAGCETPAEVATWEGLRVVRFFYNVRTHARITPYKDFNYSVRFGNLVGSIEYDSSGKCQKLYGQYRLWDGMTTTSTPLFYCYGTSSTP